jgi:hypothetical protein
VNVRPELVVGGALLEALRPLVAELVEEEVERRLADLGRRGAPRWLTLEQAGVRLGCSPAAVRMRANRGRLRSRYQGSRRYVSAEDVDDLAGGGHGLR